MLRLTRSRSLELSIALGLILALAGCQDSVAPTPSRNDTISPLIEKMAPNAAGLWLATVVEISEYDERPGDGNRGLRIHLKKKQGSGDFHPVLDIITEFGGHRAPGDNPSLPELLTPDTFDVGTEYWIAFASPHDWKRYPQSVVDVWVQGEDPRLDAVLMAVIRRNDFRWSPRFDPATGLTFGRVADKTSGTKKPQWRIRVSRDGEPLWEQTTPGTMSER